MKKLVLLMAMALTVTVGGVYATWTYTQNTDVADETINMAMNLTDVAYSGSYGTYKIDRSSLTLKIDPKPGTTHTTALLIEGNIVITFTPNSVAPETVKEEGVASTFEFGLTNSNWTFDDDTTDEVAAKTIVTLEHAEKHDIAWTRGADGVFTYTLSADDIAEHIRLTEFNLDTKVKYDAFNTALGQGQITITVSDGQTSADSE
ncbi:MAG: hypothetical protein IJF39_00105 [Clostridia bacterium]|nr:hypothetical protein [Clostridia bacterium]